jgi:hypothetical protein
LKSVGQNWNDNFHKEGCLKIAIHILESFMKRQLLAWANRIPSAFSKYAGSKQMVQKYIQVESLLAHVAAKFFHLIMFLVFN